jgi:hypothetical protein
MRHHLKKVDKKETLNSDDDDASMIEDLNMSADDHIKKYSELEEANEIKIKPNFRFHHLRHKHHSIRRH